MTDGHARLALDGVGSSEQQLHSCSSCDRVTRQRSDAGATCEFCGGALRHMWGLGQLAAHRAGRETAPLEALAVSPGAERLD
jgi:ribosomal protein L37AE/L43A